MSLDTMENRQLLATILQSEASVGNQAERSAVGWTVVNRMSRGNTEKVRDVSGQYSTAQAATAPMVQLAGQLLRGEITDPSDGATHYYSPKTMPKEGQPTSGYDVGGGLELVPPLKEKNYRPSWAGAFVEISVTGARPYMYKFHRAAGRGPVR
jgi:hypothetical protein